MEIDGTAIGYDYTPFFIAEAGVNHNGSLSRAKKLIDVAADAGADAVKFQTFSADRLVSRDTSTAGYQEETTGEDDQYEMLQRYELDRTAHESLIQYCAERGITFLSTPFDSQSASMLAEMDVNAIKIGSGDLTNHPLLAHVADLQLPTIVSTGMATMDEVRAAYDVLQTINPNIETVFLHCTSSYPSEISDVNLRAMKTIEEELSIPVGYSDHTTLPETPALATAAGACIIEKHFTLDSTLPGPDHEASLEPTELKEAIELVETAILARGNSKKKPVEAELENRSIARKSLHAAVDIQSGTELTASHIKIIRPAEGISPSEYQSVLGKEVQLDIKEDEPLKEDYLN